MRTKFKFLAVVIAMLAALLPMQPAAAAPLSLNLPLTGYEGRNEGQIAAYKNQIVANGITSNASVNFIDPVSMTLVETVPLGISGFHFSAPVVSNDKLFYIFHNTNMPTNASQGNLLKWPLYITKFDDATRSFDAPVFVCDLPGYDNATAFDGQIFIPCSDKLIVMDDSDLSIVDTIEFSGHGSQPAITSDFLWVPIHDTYISQIDRSSGSEIAQLNGCPMNQGVYATDSQLVCVGLHEVLWYDFTGAYQGRYSLPSDGLGAYYRSADATGVWICNMSSNFISHFNFATKTIDKTEFTSAPTSGSATLNNALFVVTADAKVTRIGDYVAPLEPVASDTPSITGGDVVGSTLGVDVGIWASGTTFEYQWNLDGTPISGETQDSYTPVDSDAGHLLSVVVSGSLQGFKSVTITSSPITILAIDNGGGGGGGGGTILDAPSTGLLGDALVGSTLTADTSAWPQDITLDYQWLLDGEPIDAATGADYVVQELDAGHAISVQVSGAPDGINVVSSLSESFDIALADLLSTPVPILQGTFKVGKTIGIDLGAWDDGVEFAFQWYIDNDAVDGATENTFEAPPAAVDLEVYVEVTGSKVGYNPSVQTSDPVTIEPGTLVKTPVPVIAGTAKVGQTLTANEKTWDDGVTFEYQWFAAGKAINGATEKTFALTAAQLGKAITVKVTGSLEGYVSVTKTSAATAKVAVGVMNITSVPLIVGTPKAGKAVTVNTGAWVPGAKLTIVWLLDGKAIKGAKGTSVTLAKTAKGHKLSVSVTGAAAGYISTTKVSKVVKVG